MTLHHLDCTLRDGGYHTAWDFPLKLIHDYLEAMASANVDVVELGLRSLQNTGFKGACAYTSDEFLNSLPIPERLRVAVMINASELISAASLEEALEGLFPENAASSRVDLVRIACHAHEIVDALPASVWLRQRGFAVAFNLMQIADQEESKLVHLARIATAYPIDVLYFADSMGGMCPADTARIIRCLRKSWRGDIGIHTHDNLGMALQNSLRALDEGVTWVDTTVTGMGRGPGNARTEEFAIELAERRGQAAGTIALLRLIRDYFNPMQQQHGWGRNPYYYLAGKHGIHPTYIQMMLRDNRYSEEDILAVIDYLRVHGGKHFKQDTLDTARHFYQETPTGTWDPTTLFQDREVLLLGTGPGVLAHRAALEAYIRKRRPLVMALNTQTAIAADLIDVRLACNPLRLLADCAQHRCLPQPLILPASMMPADVLRSLADKTLYDFGLCVSSGGFAFAKYHCTLPAALVFAYALGVASSGRAKSLLMAGFDGYGADDRRNKETADILAAYRQGAGCLRLLAVTPTSYDIEQASIYGLVS